MFRSNLVCLVLGALFLIASPESAFAEDCNYTWILINTDGSKPTPDQYAEKERREQECKKRLADEKTGGASARARLKKEFKIDASELSDGQAIARLDQELAGRKRADEEAQAQREAIAEAQQASRAGKLMEGQAQMLKGLGVKLGDGGEDDDDGIDPLELQMYQEMVKNGVAPECKGKQGEALIDCVDEVLDAE